MEGSGGSWWEGEGGRIVEGSGGRSWGGGREELGRWQGGEVRRRMEKEGGEGVREKKVPYSGYSVLKNFHQILLHF